MGRTVDEYIQSETLWTICNCRGRNTCTLEGNRQGVHVCKNVYTCVLYVCVHSYTHTLCVQAWPLNDTGYHKVTTSLALCVCVWPWVCLVQWQWEEGSLIRALIKKQTAYWINPVVINRTHCALPPPTLFPPSALMSLWWRSWNFVLIKLWLSYCSVLLLHFLLCCRIQDFQVKKRDKSPEFIYSRKSEKHSIRAVLLGCEKYLILAWFFWPVLWFAIYIVIVVNDQQIIIACFSYICIVCKRLYISFFSI